MTRQIVSIILWGMPGICSAGPSHLRQFSPTIVKVPPARHRGGITPHYPAPGTGRSVRTQHFPRPTFHWSQESVHHEVPAQEIACASMKRLKYFLGDFWSQNYGWFPIKTNFWCQMHDKFHCRYATSIYEKTCKWFWMRDNVKIM